MPDFTWPAELDEARKLLAVVGSFWSDTYSGSELVASLLHAKAQHQLQAQADVLDLVASMCRFNVPVFHVENWSPLVLLESQRNAANLPAFDGTVAFDSGHHFDTPLELELHSWPAPAGLVDAKVVLNQITDAALTCVKGADFFARDGVVWFRDNPFDNASVRVEDVYEGGAVVDRVAYLWVYRGEYDWDTVYKQFGYVLGSRLASSRPYKDMVNAAYDGLVEGTTARCLEDFLSAVCDVPLAKGDETVTLVASDASRNWVVTDKNAYGFSPNATAIVAVGDAVAAGDPLTDALRFYDTNRGQVPDEVRAVSLGRGLLSAAFFRELTFENKEVPLLVTEGVDGYTKVEFEVGGWAGDAEKFWADTHRNGVAIGDTIAMRLDTRETKTGQPTSASLPATVNPLQFLTENVLRGNAFFVVAKPHAFGPDAIGLHAARLLRRLVPPQTACVLLVQLEYDGDMVTMDGTGTETRPGYEEEVLVFTGDTIEDSIDPADYVAEDVRVFQIGGHCQ